MERLRDRENVGWDDCGIERFRDGETKGWGDVGM